MALAEGISLYKENQHVYIPSAGYYKFLLEVVEA